MFLGCWPVRPVDQACVLSNYFVGFGESPRVGLIIYRDASRRAWVAPCRHACPARGGAVLRAQAVRESGVAWCRRTRFLVTWSDVLSGFWKQCECVRDRACRRHGTGLA